jgi:predicted KAP-like P-loop ATPase
MKAVISREAADAINDLSEAQLAAIDDLTKRVAATDRAETVLKDNQFKRILARTPEGRPIYMARLHDLRLLFSLTEDENRQPVFVLLDVNTSSAPSPTAISHGSAERAEASQEGASKGDLALTSGAPIESLEEDNLGRANLARTLARALKRYGSGQSLIVGVNGPWGSGKTSLLNMAAAAITADAGTREPIIARFNPWNFSNQEQLVAEFFDNLATAVNIPSLGSKYERAAALIEDFGRRLKPFTIFPQYGKLLEFAVKGSEVLAKGLKRDGEQLRSLESTKAEISRALLDLGRRIVVIIDDIDRLTNEEIRRLFQLVKASGDFANVIYLMAFDKNVVLRALESEQGGSGEAYGEAYLEKIVNVLLDVPPLTNAQVQRLLLERLNGFAERHPDYLWRADNRRVVDLLTFQQEVFKSIRSLDRFMNLLAFSEPLIGGEVDYVDFLAITTLQTIVPRLYYFIRDNPDLFIETKENIILRSAEREKKQRDAIDEALNAHKGTVDRDLLLRALTSLFPRLAGIYRGNPPSDAEIARWTIERRIGSGLEAFGFYFQLSVPEDALSARRMLAIVENLQESSLRTSLDELISEHKGLVFLEELKLYRDDPLVQARIKDILVVLFDVGDAFPRDIRGFPFQFDGPTLIMQLAYQLLSRNPDELVRFDVLRSAIQAATNSLSPLVTQVSVEDQAHGKFELGGTGNSDQWLVSEEHLVELERLALSKIEDWAQTGRLQEHPELPFILFRWRNWGTPDDVARYVLSRLSDEYFLRLLVRLAESASHEKFGGSVRLQDTAIAKLAPIDAVQRRLEEIRRKGGSDISRATLEEFDALVKPDPQ